MKCILHNLQRRTLNLNDSPQGCIVKPARPQALFFVCAPSTQLHRHASFNANPVNVNRAQFATHLPGSYDTQRDMIGKLMARNCELEIDFTQSASNKRASCTLRRFLFSCLLNRLLRNRERAREGGGGEVLTYLRVELE